VKLDCRTAVVLTMTLTLLGLVSEALAPATPRARARPKLAPIAIGSDLLGNEVKPAVASYKFDTTGVLYEEHSPQTELPELGDPHS
jgi:hypothetical protein